MIRIKHARSAKTKSCKDAVTGSAKAAGVLKSKAAEYSKIDIHNVRDADILKFKGDTADTIPAGHKYVSFRYMKADRIHTHSVRCRNGRDNLTLDELFCNMGGRK